MCSIDVQVRLEVGPGAITGLMTPPSGTPVPFVGWLALIDAVERLHEHVDERATGQRATETPPTDETQTPQASQESS